jgi:hypothetical protein
MPQFFSSEELFLDCTWPTTPASEDAYDNITLMHSDKLHEIWRTLRRFCHLINELSCNGDTVPQELILHVMASAMYGLLKIDNFDNATEEALRLSMLSLCATVFLQWPRLQVPFPWLRDRFYKAIQVVMQDITSPLDDQAILWILCIYTTSFTPLNSDEHRDLHAGLSQSVARCQLKTWEDARSLLDRYLWIDLICSQETFRLLLTNIIRSVQPGFKLGNT